MKRRILIFMMFISMLSMAACGCGGDRDPAVRSYVNKRAVNIGDRVRYTIEVRTGKKTDIAFPKFDAQKVEGQDDTARIGGFEIKDSGTRVKDGMFGGRTYFNWYDITAYSTDKVHIPVVTVKFRPIGRKEWSTKETYEIAVNIDSVLPKGQKISDIMDIKGPMQPFEINWWLIGGLALFSLLVVNLIRGIIAMRNRAVIKSPYEIATQELAAIHLADVSAGNAKEFYVAVSDCVRRYIEGVFDLRAPEMTTEEFLATVQGSKELAAQYTHLLKEFLEACDLVKFAKYVPKRPEIESVFNAAKKFIDETHSALSKTGEEK
jgi:hypothetical protein